MSNVKSFNINGEDASIHIVSNTENGLMSYTDYNILNNLNLNVFGTNLEIDISTLDIINYIVNSNGIWITSDNTRGVFYEISAYHECTITVTYPDTASSAYISFLKDDTYSSNGNPNFSDIYTTRVDAGEYTIPSDANYIYFNISPSSALNIVYPSAITIAKESIISTKEYVDTNITTLENKLYGNTINVSLSEIELTKAIINGYNVWNLSENSRGIFYDVSIYHGYTINVEYPSTASATNISFLKDNTVSSSDTPNFSNTYATRVEPGEYVIPDDTNYIYFNISPASVLNIVYPSTVEIIYNSSFLTIDDFNDLNSSVINLYNKYSVNESYLDYPDFKDVSAYDNTYTGFTNRLEQFYSLYDELVSIYPDYITKINLDDTLNISDAPYDVSTYPMYAYQFSPNWYTSVKNYKNTPKIMVVTGTHIEYVSIYSIYSVMKRICEDWRTDKNINELRHNVEFYLIPCSSPWQIANNSQRNINNVNLNRNCGTTQWTYDSSSYTGESADSEYETKMFEQAYLNYNPDIFFDIHNFNATETYAITGNFMMIYAGNSTYAPVLAKLAADETYRLLIEYPDDVYQDEDKVLSGFAIYSETSHPGRRGLWAYEHGCIFTGNVEIRPSFVWNSGSVDYTDIVYGDSKAISIGTDIYTNLFMTTIKSLISNKYI